MVLFVCFFVVGLWLVEFERKATLSVKVSVVIDLALFSASELSAALCEVDLKCASQSVRISLFIKVWGG